MPAGEVQVAHEEKLCAVTIIVLATVVLMLGVAWLKLLAVFWPASASIGFPVSTPANV
jgi:hypothetical protein